MQYNCLSEYLGKEEYINDLIYPYIFIRKSKSGFTIVAIYVDDMNLIGTSKEPLKVVQYLKKNLK